MFIVRSFTVGLVSFCSWHFSVVDVPYSHFATDTTRHQITIVNPGKFSVDYLWQWRTPSGPALRLSGAKQVNIYAPGPRRRRYFSTWSHYYRAHTRHSEHIVKRTGRK